MRSTKPESTQKINAALSLIKEHGTHSKAADAMVKEFDISRRQAYRYLKKATKIGKELAVPELKMAFTVKLSQSLIQALREYSKLSGESLSDIVTQSLEDFLQNGTGQSFK